MLRQIFLLLLCVTVGSLSAQDTEAVQIHGFATQGLIYSSQDNYLTSRSSDGDPGWSEGVLSITGTPISKFRVGVQLHYFRFGNLGSDGPTVDWVLGDYRVTDYFGIRAGKVKTPLGLFNDSQDVDAVFLWSLLPQSMYAIDNRSFFLAHYGGEVYGSIALGARVGKLSYRAYGGQNSISRNGGYVQQLASLTHLQFAGSLSGPIYGGDVRWQTPYAPLLVGSSLFVQHVSAQAAGGSVSFRTSIWAYYLQFDKGRFYGAGEYRRQPNYGTVNIGSASQSVESSQQKWYAMASYRVTNELQLGMYYSHLIDGSLPGFQQESSSKDLALSSRYDFNTHFYAKAEGHFLHGTATGFFSDNNPLGLKSRTALVIAKFGFQF